MLADDDVVLVDELDAAIGVAPKFDVPRDGRLHRAVSVMLFDRVWLADVLSCAETAARSA